MFRFTTFSIFTKNKFVVFLLGFSLWSQIFAQNPLAENSEISILTCSKGDDLYNTFGHTAIRIQDPAQQLDVVFNYGMFSFGGSGTADQVKFGIKFIRGKLEYWLGAEDFDDFVWSYQYNQRWVYEQKLNLTLTQKQKLFDALIINYQPENRAYQYDFFFDNCSSRVRDILEDAVGPVFGDELSDIHNPTDSSFIDLIDPYICDKPWLDFGMDMMLGLPSSRKASKYEFMFLPYHLQNQISLAPGLVKSEGMLIPFPDRPIGKRSFSFTSPFAIFTFLFLLIAFFTYKAYKAGKHSFALDRILLFISGLLGILFFFMWVATNHIPAHANLNMFWAFPLNLIALFFVHNKKYLMYFKWIAGINAFIFLAWFLSPQQYNLAVIPLAAIFLVRYIKIIEFHSPKA
jgi:hypothetical protein